MDQLNLTNTRSDPKSLYLTAILFCILAAATGFWEDMHPRQQQDLIQWCVLSDASNKSIAANKPILYVFSATWCPPCRKMEATAFSSKRIADLINAEYVPVLLMDQDGTAGERGRTLQKQYGVTAFPTLLAVNPRFIKADPNDLFSSGNRIERKLAMSFDWVGEGDNNSSDYYKSDSYQDTIDNYFSSSREHLPAHTGYSDNNELYSYLCQALRWHKFPPDRGSVHWENLSALHRSSTRPRMIVMLDEFGALSDRVRIRLFSDPDFYRIASQQFEPILVEIRMGLKPAAEVAELKKRFAISKLPAIVVLKDGMEPQIEDGFTSARHTLQFLARSAKLDLPKESGEEND